MNKKEIKYVIPWSIVIRGYSFWYSLVAFLSIIDLGLIGFAAYLNASTYLVYFSWLGFLFIIFFVIFGLLDAYGKSNPICKWILDNITCPNCGGKINSCSYRVAAQNFAVYNYAEYKVQCNKCNETFYFGELGSFWGPHNIILTERHMEHLRVSIIRLVIIFIFVITFVYFIRRFIP